MGLRITKNTTHPKKSAWSDVPYREGERISSGYSVSLVLRVPSPIAAITKRTGRTIWATKPLTSRRVWWNLLMNKADVFLSSNGKPCRLFDLIRSWSVYKRMHFSWISICEKQGIDGYSTLGVHLVSCTPLTDGKSKLLSWNIHRGQAWDRTQILALES